MLHILGVFVALGIRHAKNACALLCFHLWPVWLYEIFPLFLINGTIFKKKKVIEHVLCVFFLFFLQILSATFLILTTERDMINNDYGSSCKVPIILSDFNNNFDFSQNILQKHTNVKLHGNPCSGGGGDLYHADGRTDEGTEGQTRSQLKKKWLFAILRKRLKSTYFLILVLWTEIHINYLGWIMIQIGDGCCSLHSSLCRLYDCIYLSSPFWIIIYHLGILCTPFHKNISRKKFLKSNVFAQQHYITLLKSKF